MAKVLNGDGLSGSQVIILNVLAKASAGLTAHEISHAGKGVPVNTGTIGPVFDSVLHNYQDSLRGRGLVRAEQYEGDEVRWFITDKGMKTCAGKKGRLVGPDVKIPPTILDPALIAFKKTRAYGLEQYTDADLTELRGKLPKDYHSVELDDLMRQINARRKQGAFVDPEEQRLKAMKKVLKEFGPTGTMMKGFLTEDQVQELLARLGNDVEAE